MNYVDHFNLFGVDAKQIPCDTGEGAPTTSTVGPVGGFYMDTLTGDVYKCVSADGGVYTWELFGDGSPDAVKYTEQTLTPEQQTQARANIGAVSVDVIGESVTLSSSDFVNGLQTIGQGITASDYAITTATPVPVKIGDKISIKPNGQVAWIQIESVDNFANVTTHLYNKSDIITDTIYISEYDGFCFISVQAGGQKITPESYSCDITIGVSRIDTLVEQIAEVKNLMDAAVLYTEQTLTNEQKAQARANIGVSDDAVGGSTVLSSSDFVNGTQTIGTGIKASEYWITLATPVPVKIGDKIVIKPNGFRVMLQIESVDNFADVTTHLVNKGNITTDTEYVSEHDGFCFISVASTAGAKITPESYSCDITIGVSRLDELEERVDEVSTRMNAVEEAVPEVHYVSSKYKSFTRIVNDCQDASKWTITNNSTSISSVDTTDFIIGTQSLRSDNQMRCVNNTYDMLHNDLIVKFRINSIATGARLYLSIAQLATPSKRVLYELARGTNWTTPTDWQEIAIPYTGHSTMSDANALEFDFSKVEDLIFMASEGAVDWSLQYIGLRPRALSKGIVTFTFDDGYDSQYTGIKILAERGITGTIFHIKQATENNPNGEYLTISELQELVNRYDTDIEVHGDPSYDQWDETDLVTHWGDTQEWFKENGLGDGKHMAYPNGIFPENVVQLARRYFDSCRTIKPFIPLETYPPADRYRLRAVSGIGNTAASVETVKRHIDKAVEAGAWLILVFHKIGTGDGSTMYCPEANLKEIADYAIASGAYIMNYAEVFDSGAVM